MKIVAKYLKKVYDNGGYGLRDVNLSIVSGDFAVILGESGCGKSTLLRTIAGLEKTTAGELYLDGLLAEGVAAKDRNVSMVFQECVLYPRFTVWENLATALERYNLPREEQDSRIREVLKVFDLVSVAGQLPKSLSGGQQQRVALARALVSRPKAILFDEPLSNVAETQRADYVKYIKELKNSLPYVTFLYVTHNVTEALALADTLVVMKDGCVLQQGKKDFVLNNPYSADVLQAVCNQVDRQGDEWFNPYRQTWQRFDNGLVGGQRQKLNLQGTFDGKTLDFCNVQIAVDENFRYRFIGKKGNVIVGIDTDQIRANALFDDVQLTAERVDEHNYKFADGTIVCLKNIENFNGKLCFSQNALQLFDTNGRRILAHYHVYQNVVSAKTFGKSLLLPSGKVKLSSAPHGRVRVTFGKNVQATVAKRGLKIKKCLDEETFGNKKLCYCYVKGFPNYLALWVDAKTPFLRNSTKLKITDSTLKIERI